MKKTIAVFALGVVVGYGASLLKNDDVPAIVASEEQDLVTEDSESTIVKAQLPPVSSEPLPATEIPVVEPKQDVASEEFDNSSEAPETFNLDIAESELTLMEDNLPDLQQAVSLTRTEDGWIVQFNSPANILQTMGMKDRDLIRFNSLESLKQDPTKVLMAQRLESLFSHLER